MTAWGRAPAAALIKTYACHKKYCFDLTVRWHTIQLVGCGVR